MDRTFWVNDSHFLQQTKPGGFENRRGVKGKKDDTHASSTDKRAATVGCKGTPGGNHVMERKDFFLGDAAAEGEARRFCGCDGPALGGLITGRGTSSG